jgi:3'(2'), 5'-bisphosphate nucleotidase
MRDQSMTDTLTALAREAGDAIMAVYESDDFEVRAKGDDSPVTEADLAADRIIVAGLEAAFPDIAVVTEERAESHDLGEGRTHFLVDPLDGTREFVNRRGDFTVNIALIVGGVPVAGIVYAPAIGRLFRTNANGGAEEVTAHGGVQPLCVAQADNAALRVVASKSHRDAETDAYIARYNVTGFKSAGSSLKFCLLAAGEADLYPRLGRTMEWDTAAAHAVLYAAGGQVVTFDDLTPLVYGKANRANPFFIAYGAGVRLVQT